MSAILNYQKVFQALFQGLSPRQKDIIIRRFGLESGNGETLEAIGKDLGLTRERVRQIIETTLVKARKESFASEINRALLAFKSYLQKNGGLKKEKILLSEPIFNHQQNSSNWINFLLVLEGSFCRVGETKELHSFWALDSKISSAAEKLIKALNKELTRFKKPLGVKELFLMSRAAGNSNQRFLKSVLETSKEILETNDGKYGLKSWPEVNPRGVRDLAFLVFKKAKKPLHFTEVASLIDEFSFKKEGHKEEFSIIGASAQAQKKTNFQTVHNQLIKDPQFILIGRGIYALREWGYAPGTVKEIISKVLKESKQPLSEREILKEVLSQRLVKESTVVLNLGNKKCFLKSEDGRYSPREA
ncbi:MAG: sigma factor-like helix-turn-helix DNA-binding protein [bacterium]|nr:sigma factor-like helix-turn-helix DNA-binding protein [bacterium]